MDCYSYFEEIYRDEFEKYTGMDTKDKTVKLFTEEEQVERYSRYSKVLSFWVMLKGKVTLSKKINPEFYNKHKDNLNYINSMICYNEHNIKCLFPIPALKEVNC